VKASPPRVVTGRRRQRELVRSWSGWPLTSTLIDPVELTQAHERLVGNASPAPGERIVGTSEGLGFGVDGSWGNPAEVIPWPEVETISRAAPDDVLAELVEFRAR
jgi:hypothetical protein